MNRSKPVAPRAEEPRPEPPTPAAASSLQAPTLPDNQNFRVVMDSRGKSLGVKLEKNPWGPGNSVAFYSISPSWVWTFSGAGYDVETFLGGTAGLMLDLGSRWSIDAKTANDLRSWVRMVEEKSR